MPRTFSLAVIALAVGCATTPSFNSVNTQPAVESHDDVAGHQHISSGGQVVLASNSVESETDDWTLRQTSGTDRLPTSKTQGAIFLPTWSPDDTDLATSDQVTTSARPSSVMLPHYIVEKDAPAKDMDLTTSNDRSDPPRKSPFMLLRMTETKNPPFRQN